ncbi:MAG: ferritin family protein [Desulfobacterota bacterium]|nr:ferritin family protein [Thermodesulfobacteriota bacterium]
MSIFFNADEIFQIGIRIETNGRAFYAAVAQGSFDPALKGLFEELSKWESEHIELFERLRQALPEAARRGGAFDPGQELALYLQATADTHVFVKNRDVSDLASRCRTPLEALGLAITFEKDSVVFYTTMKQVVPEGFGREQIDRLIDEELRHISLLHQKVRGLEGV